MRRIENYRFPTPDATSQIREHGLDSERWLMPFRSTG